MRLKPGAKLRSVVCTAEVIVVRAPAAEVEVGCGGAPLAGDGAPLGGVPDPELAGGALIGKRYAHEGLGLELLCTRAGVGTLTVDGEVLAVKGAKPLPASD
jgi:hypothetical protein